MLLRSLRKVPALLAVLVALVASSVVLSAAPASAKSWFVPDYNDVLKVTPKTASQAGRVLTPARMVTSLTPWGLAANTAGVAFMWWSFDTESGRNFWSGIAESLPFANTPGADCTTNLGTLGQWSQHSYVGSAVPPTGETRTHYPEPFDFEPCAQFMERITRASVQGYGVCMKPDGQFYTGGSLLIYHWQPSTSPPLCANGADDWLVGVHLARPAGDVLLNYQGPDYVANPFAPAHPDGLDPLDGTTKVKVTVKCSRPDGSGLEQFVVEYSPSLGGSYTKPKCSFGRGYSGYDVGVSRYGSPFAPVTSWARDVAAANAAGCFAFNAYGQEATCALQVVNAGTGEVCAYGRPGCSSWYETEIGAPGSFECKWGSTVVPIDDCLPLRFGYSTPGGAYDSGPTHSYVPVPYYPPGSTGVPAPFAPGDGSDMNWLGTGSCSPTGSPFEAGLQPIALSGLRCFMAAFPNFNITSGYRQQGSVPDSLHPFGLAVDIAPSPSWDTAAGNEAGWGAAGWVVGNAQRMGVREVIWNRKIWTPSTGWVPYSHPSGISNPSYDHDNHLHIGFAPVGAPAPGVGTGSWPQPGPITAPPPGTDPGTGNPVPDPTDPNPDPVPPTIPETGTNPDDPDGCLASSWTWDPMSWVLSPVKCALVWAFVPKTETVTQVQADVADAFGATGVTTWVDVVGTIPDALDADESAASCRGPGMALPEPIGTIYVLDACSGIRATLAAACKTIAGASIAVGALLSCLSLVSRALGYDTAISTVTAPLAAGGSLAPADRTIPGDYLIPQGPRTYELDGPSAAAGKMKWNKRNSS